MPEETLEQFLESKRKDGSQKKYEDNLQAYDIANQYMGHIIEEYLKNLQTHSKEKYLEIFNAFDYAPFLQINLKSFESMYARIYEGKYKEAEIFTEVPDIGRTRIVCRTLDQINFLKEYFVNGYLIGKIGLHQDKTKNYSEKPSSSGYRAINYNLIIPNKAIGVPNDIRYELQLMTEMQHTWTELSHIFVYKNPNLDMYRIKFMEKQMMRISDIIHALDEMYKDIHDEVKKKPDSKQESLNS